MTKTTSTIRCQWANQDPLLMDYHDNEWGIPVFDDQKLFEFLILEGAQAGLSWITVLKKRDAYRECLDGFDPEKIALYTQKKIDSLLTNPGIIRNRLKIKSTITNAQAYLNILEEQGSFSDYIWNFVDGKPLQNHWLTLDQVPCKTALSNTLSLHLKKKGFAFVGSTICYAFMQATGMVNDHTVDCFCYARR